MNDKMFAIYQDLRARLEWLSEQDTVEEGEVALLLSQDFPVEE